MHVNIKFLAISLVNSNKHSIFAAKRKNMIEVNHINAELKALIEKGRSSAYEKLQSKAAFLKALRAFFFLLNIVNDTNELSKYWHLHYKRGVEQSSVLIVASKIRGLLLIKEMEEGRKIDILELKY